MNKDKNIIAFKQGNKINEWWLCSNIDLHYILHLLNLIIDNHTKKHKTHYKIQYKNQKDELCYLEGTLLSDNTDNIIKHNNYKDLEIIYYNENCKKLIRRILLMCLPNHNGLIQEKDMDNDNDNDKINISSLYNNKQYKKHNKISYKNSKSNKKKTSLKGKGNKK